MLVCLLPGRRARDIVAMREYQRTYRETHRGDIAERERVDRRLAHRDLSKYGLSRADYEALYLWQGGRCACCWQAPATDVDHDHETGRVRGLVCNPCNLMIGHARDDPSRLRAGAAYLDNQPKETP